MLNTIRPLPPPFPNDEPSFNHPANGIVELFFLTGLMVYSALEGYKLNNNANGYQMPEFSNATDGSGAQGDLYFENGIRTPGLTSIPICTLHVVSQNWQDHGKNKNKPEGYPCNELVTERGREEREADLEGGWGGRSRVHWNLFHR